MKKIIIVSAIAFILGSCITISVIAVRTVLSMQTSLAQHEVAIQQIVGFINQSIEASKQSPQSQPQINNK